METNPELNNVVIEGNILHEHPKKIKNTKPKILIIEEEESLDLSQSNNVKINKKTSTCLLKNSSKNLIPKVNEYEIK